MNAQQFADLVWNSQMGDTQATEQLLLKIHGPVAYLTDKILQDQDSARQVTQEVLETISTRLESLEEPAQFQKWLCRITAARCMRVMPLFQAIDTSAPSQMPWLEELSDNQALTEVQSANVIQQMVDSLPQNQRLCLLLLGCGGLGIASIAQLTGFSEATVSQHIQEGQAAVQRYLSQLQDRGIQFSGLSSLTGILRLAMFSSVNEEAAIPTVYPLLGKEIPVPPDPTKWMVRMLSVILGVLVTADVAAAGLLLFRIILS